MACNNLSGDLTGSALGQLDLGSLQASFPNTAVNFKTNFFPLTFGLPLNIPLFATLTGSLVASHRSIEGLFYTQSFHVYLLEGSLNDPVPLSMCAESNDPTGQP
tara:strand:+ start:1299 stop:1610 length:312 start_codon:yes stop_codon:yes gene_type:complete